jgi:hypothetical protein
VIDEELAVIIPDYGPEVWTVIMISDWYRCRLGSGLCLYTKMP